MISVTLKVADVTKLCRFFSEKSSVLRKEKQLASSRFIGRQSAEEKKQRQVFKVFIVGKICRFPADVGIGAWR